MFRALRSPRRSLRAIEEAKAARFASQPIHFRNTSIRDACEAIGKPFDAARQLALKQAAKFAESQSQTVVLQQSLTTNQGVLAEMEAIVAADVAQESRSTSWNYADGAAWVCHSGSSHVDLEFCRWL